MGIDVLSPFNRKPTRHNRLCLGDIWTRNAQRWPEREALVAWKGACGHKENERLTYKQANEKACQFAHALLEKGLMRGDRVLLFCGNSVEFLIIHQGIAKAGMVAVPVNLAVPGDLLVFIIGKVQPRLVVVDAETYPLAAGYLKRAGLKVDVTVPIGGNVVEESQSFEEFIKGKPTTDPDVVVQGDDIVQIQFTAGTTAFPKGAMQSHTFMAVGALNLALLNGMNYASRMNVIYPLFHVALQLVYYSSSIYGCTAFIARRPSRPHLYAEMVSECKLTFMYVAPWDIYDMVDLAEKDPGKYDYSSLKHIAYGWAAFNPDYHERLNKLAGHEVVIRGHDGSTEVCPTPIYFCHNEHWEKYKKYEPELNYFGVSAPIFQVEIMDEEGNILPPGQQGEIVWRGPCIMSGYWRDEERTKEALRYGWFHSGDGGYKDEEGLVVFTDRIKDVIKSGGENVTSLRVEEVIKKHSKVNMVAVIGLPHERWIEAVTAVVVPKEGEQPTEEEIIDWCKQSALAGYEVPKKVVFREDIPMSVGKVRKFVLREEYKDLFKGEK